MSNFIIIGMPGCGKTSIGKAAAKRAKMEFIDLDQLITENHGDITGIFENEGEKVFREYETQALKESAKGKCSIISSGGGIVELQRNLDILKENQVIFIDRDLESIFSTLNSESRPLLKGKEKVLHDLYDRRYNKYIKAMNFHVKNDGSFNDCVCKVLEIIKS